DSNLYRYVTNRPTVAMDPSGLWKVFLENTYSRGKDELKGGFETARITIGLDYEKVGNSLAARIRYNVLIPKKALQQFSGWSLFSLINNFDKPGDTSFALESRKLDDPVYRGELLGVFNLGSGKI